MAYVEVTCHTLQTRTIYNTILLSIRQRSIELSLIITTIYTCLIVLVRTIFEESVTPISPAILWFCCIIINISISKCCSRSIGCTINIVVSIVLQALINQGTTRITIQRWTIVDSHVRESPVATEINLGLTCTTTLGCNDKHTIGCTRTIQRGCGSILDNSDRFDIVAVQCRKCIGTRTIVTSLCGTIIETTQVTRVHRSTINHNQWIITCIDRTHTTNTDIVHCTWLARERRNRNSWDITRKLIFNRK